MPEYDRVSAGELRSRGYAIPEQIPDCAEIPRYAIVPRLESVQIYPQEPTRIDMVFEVKFTEPFTWVHGVYSVKTP